MLNISELIRIEDEKPPVDKTVLFVWWHREGIETSQKTLGFIDSNGDLNLDFNPSVKKPIFWCHLFEK